MLGSGKRFAYRVGATGQAGFTRNGAGGMGRLKTAARAYRHVVFDLKIQKQCSPDVPVFQPALCANGCSARCSGPELDAEILGFVSGSLDSFLILVNSYQV